MDREKFKSLVHYICWKCDDPTKLGATKLNKIVWFAERANFLRTGLPITGVKFTKQEHGPVPSAILSILADLQAEQRLYIRESKFYDYTKREFISLREPDFAAFTSEQISTIDSVIEAICYRHTASSISDRTHDEIWDLAEIGEEIPMFAILGRRAPLQAEDMQWIREHGKA